jgi:CheY-like chemotaxis protein
MLQQDISMQEERPENYFISCYNCSVPYDALDAAWCSCIGGSQTVICPSCLRCFCRADRKYLDGFWTHAPQVVWDNKIKLEKEVRSYATHGTEDHRPLVLVIDDEPLIRNMAVMTIEKLGYQTIAARDGIEGFALAKRHKPDLILSDMLMPGIEGSQLCRLIKTDPETAGMKIILMTSLYTKAKHKMELFKQIAPDDYLSKPFAFDQLWESLHKHLG